MSPNKKTPVREDKCLYKHYRPFAHLSQEQLMEILENHDCHAGPEDGCECHLIKDELTIRVIGERAFYGGQII